MLPAIFPHFQKRASSLIPTLSNKTRPSIRVEEINYSVTDKEGLAVIFALKKIFRSYIAASYFNE